MAISYRNCEDNSIHRNKHVIAIAQSLPSVIPNNFSLRCKADRSMPMKFAVREMFPEKRLDLDAQILTLEIFARFAQRVRHDGVSTMPSIRRYRSLVASAGQHVQIRSGRFDRSARGSSCAR
jgi:hypothetical protein